MSTKNDVSQMSDEEIELTLELLKRKRGAAVAQPVAASPARAVDVDEENVDPNFDIVENKPIHPVVRLAPKAKTLIEDRWFSTTKTCPHCGKTKNVGKEFGVVVTRGVQYAASWCKQCRGATSYGYRTQPRRNKTKHNPDAPGNPRSRKKPK